MEGRRPACLVTQAPAFRMHRSRTVSTARAGAALRLGWSQGKEPKGRFSKNVLNCLCQENMESSRCITAAGGWQGPPWPGGECLHPELWDYTSPSQCWCCPMDSQSLQYPLGCPPSDCNLQERQLLFWVHNWLFTCTQGPGSLSGKLSALINLQKTVSWGAK